MGAFINKILTTALASLPGVFLTLMRPFMTEKFWLRIWGKIVVTGARKFAKSTKTTFDDERVEEYVQELKRQGVPVD